jgi:hypothetical protein
MTACAGPVSRAPRSVKRSATVRCRTGTVRSAGVSFLCGPGLAVHRFALRRIRDTRGNFVTKAQSPLLPSSLAVALLRASASMIWRPIRVAGSPPQFDRITMPSFCCGIMPI